MNDNFAVVRRSLMPPSFGCSCRHCEALRRVPDILTAIEAELASDRKTLAAWMNANGFLAGPQDSMGDMLTEIGYVVKRLRDNALDFLKVPRRWYVETIRKMPNGEWYIAMAQEDNGQAGLLGFGLRSSTPAAALNAAVAKIGGGE